MHAYSQNRPASEDHSCRWGPPSMTIECSRVESRPAATSKHVVTCRSAFCCRDTAAERFRPTYPLSEPAKKRRRMPKQVRPTPTQYRGDLDKRTLPAFGREHAVLHVDRRAGRVGNACDEVLEAPGDHYVETAVLNARAGINHFHRALQRRDVHGANRVLEPGGGHNATFANHPSGPSLRR